jgi:hypothetical protein
MRIKDAGGLQQTAGFTDKAALSSAPPVCKSQTLESEPLSGFRGFEQSGLQ